MSDKPKPEHGIAAMRVTDMPNPVPGSRVYHCYYCNCEVYVTDVTWLQAGPKASPICMSCVETYMQETDTISEPQGKARDALKDLGMTDKDIDEQIVELRKKYLK